MIDAETFEIEPIRVGRPWAQEIQFDAAVFTGSYSGNIVETTAGPVLIAGASITAVSGDTIQIALSAAQTAALDAIHFDQKRGIDQGHVIIDIMETTADPDNPANVLLRIPVIRSL